MWISVCKHAEPECVKHVQGQSCGTETGLSDEWGCKIRFGFLDFQQYASLQTYLTVAPLRLQNTVTSRYRPTPGSDGAESGCLNNTVPQDAEFNYLVSLTFVRRSVLKYLNRITFRIKVDSRMRLFSLAVEWMRRVVSLRRYSGLKPEHCTVCCRVNGACSVKRSDPLSKDSDTTL